VTGWTDQTVILCDPSGQDTRKLAGHNDIPVVSAFSPDGRHLVTADLGGELIVWDTASGKEVRRLRGHTSLVSGLSFHPRGLRLASASNGMIVRRGTFDVSGLRAEVRLWDLPTGREVLVLPGKTAVAFSPDGHRLAAVAPSHIFEPGAIQIWDATPAPDQP
jgi:WD40 repeat protein